jgi:hypothetical protein
MKSHHAEVLELSWAAEKTRIFNALQTTIPQNRPMQNLCTNKNDAETSAKPTHVVQRKSTARVSGGAW